MACSSSGERREEFMPKFMTAIMQAEGMNATGIVVPDEVVTKLGQGKKPKVVVSLKGYSYR